MTTFATFDDLIAAIGRELGPGPWHVIDQARINRFAEVTEDRQWLHTDSGRAARESPFGTTVAHGFLTLSLVSAMLMQLVAVEEAKTVVNYGLNRVRFPAPVVRGSSVRLRFTIAEATTVAGGVQVRFDLTVETDRQAKPACVAELLFRYLR